MAFSETVVQQREIQAKTLKRFVLYSLAGSLVLHGGGLFFKVAALRNSDEPAPEEITIVVTPSQTETAIAPVETPQELPTEPTPVTPVPPSEPLSEMAIVEPTVEALPPDAESEPLPDAEAVDPEEPVEPSAQSPTESPEAIAPAEGSTRNLDSLLAELRRARQSTGQSGDTGEPEDIGSSSGESADVATAPTPPASPAPPAPEPPSRRSREIVCQGCNFDYPEEADGAEGTAQVIVETDSQGRVISVTLSRSSGNAVLDRAALQQARRRVRLRNARAGESYPIEVTFVQPDSEAAQAAEERGDRRSITVSDPEPEPEVADTPEPEVISDESPESSTVTEEETEEETAPEPETIQTPEPSPASPPASDVPPPPTDITPQPQPESPTPSPSPLPDETL